MRWHILNPAQLEYAACDVLVGSLIFFTYWNLLWEKSDEIYRLKQKLEAFYEVKTVTHAVANTEAKLIPFGLNLIPNVLSQSSINSSLEATCQGRIQKLEVKQLETWMINSKTIFLMVMTQMNNNMYSSQNLMRLTDFLIRRIKNSPTSTCSTSL